MAQTAPATLLMSQDPKLADIPTYGCIYCAHNTGCYVCAGHGIVGDMLDSDSRYVLEACRSCMSACSACKITRTVLYSMVKGSA